MKLREFGFSALLVVAILQVLPAAAQTGADRLITLTGTGTVEAVPDMATVTVGVTHHAKTAVEALEMVNNSTRRTQERLEAAGIEPRDLQTSGLSLAPRWERRESGQNRQEIIGYVASNQITVRVRDLAVLGPVLDEVVAVGANSFGGLQFGVADPAPLLQRARRQAVRDGLRNARIYAAAAGVTLGDVVSITESGGYSPRPAPMMRAEMAMADAVPISEGEVSFSVTVNMEIAIAP